MKPSACQKGGSIYINYFNKKIYKNLSFLVDVFLLLRGFGLLAFDTLHSACRTVRKTSKPAWLQGLWLARCPAK
jgi:hypothetical protein